MAYKLSPLNKPRNHNFVDETILSTPLPEATSTVNNNRSPCHVVEPTKPVPKAGSGSRLTSTIKDLESFSKALTGAGKMSFGRNQSILSATDGNFNQSLDSKSSLGLLDIDTLLENETLNNSQEIMESLYKIRDMRINMSSESSGKNASIEGADGSSTTYILHHPITSMVNVQEPKIPKVDASVLGVPSFFLKSDSLASDAYSFMDLPSPCPSKDVSLSEASIEVAAIMDKRSSRDSGRISFEPDELSARSTSLGVSDEGSQFSNLETNTASTSAMDNGFDDENFIADESDLLKKLEKDEESFACKQLPPIIPECIPEPQKLEISTFSGVIGEGQIVVRPSWVGLEGVNDEPINMSVGEFFRLKSDVLSTEIDGHHSPNERPNFGMKITSPKRNGQRLALVSVSQNESAFPNPESSHPIFKQKNETQVLSPETIPQKLSFIDDGYNVDDTMRDTTDLSVISTPSISCINNILNEIDANDSPSTMANKFLRYSSSSSKGRKINESSSYNKDTSKNDLVKTFYDSKSNVQSQLSFDSPDKAANEVRILGKTIDKTTYVRGVAVDAKEEECKKYQIPDLIKKLNLMDLRGQAEGSPLKNMASMVQILKHNVAGPLDCSALYESLANEMNIEGETNLDSSVMSCGPIKDEYETTSNQGYKEDNPWVEIPEELLLATGEGDVLKQRHCVGIGFTAHVPIKNITNNWLMYEVSFLKRKSVGDVMVQKLPVQTLLSPGSFVEFEAIVAPMSVGDHSIALEIKVTNFMAQRESSVQTYLCRLTLSSDVPKIMLMTLNMTELKVGNELDFGLLPEDCCKKIQIHLLNIGKSDIPIRLVIEEMPSVFQPFGICDAARSPLIKQDQAECKPSKDGILLERNDLLACDLSGSGPHSMVAVSLAFNSPRIKDVALGGSCIIDPSKMMKLTARLRVELDVPSTLSSEHTLLQEVILFGTVGKTKLSIATDSETLMLYSKEVVLPLETSSGRHSQSSRSPTKSHKMYKPVSEYVPICNSGAVPLDMKISIRQSNGVVSENEDVMVIFPDTLVLQPGEKFPLKVTYQPTVEQANECDRVLSIILNPNGPEYEVKLKGIPLPMESRRSLPKKEMSVEVTAVLTSKHKRAAPSETNVIQATHIALVWGSIPVGSDFAEMSFALRNSSEKMVRMTVVVADCDDYKFLNHKSDMVGKASFNLLPKETEKMKVFFRPKKLGPAAGKLSISVFDIKHPDKNITNKMIPLYGYGGHCKVETISLPRDLAGRLWLNLGLISTACSVSSFNSPQRLRLSRPSSPFSPAPSVKNRLQFHNSGTLPAFVKIVPLMLGIDSKSLSHLEEAIEHRVTVRPEIFQLSPSSSTTVWVNYVVNADGSAKSKNKGSKRVQEEVAKLLVLSGDVPTRIRLQRMYKIAEATQNTKDPGQCLGLGGTSLSFIGAISSHDGIKPELIEEVVDSEGEMSVNSLCDPTKKEAVNSLVQNLTKFEVMLVVEKDDNSEEDVRSSTGDLTMSLANNSLEFHSLLDDGDNNLLQFPCMQNFDDGLKRRKTNDIWSIDPKGTIHLGQSKGLSASLVLRSFTDADLYFQTKLGIRGENDSIEWLHHSQRHAAKCPLTVEPLQGQLPRYGSVVLKASLPQLPSCSSNDAVLQIFSENHCLKVNIKIEGWGVTLATKQRQKSYVGSGITVSEVKVVTLDKKEMEPSERPMLRKSNNRKENHVYADNSAVLFPTTKVGDYVSMKITLKNISCESHEIQFHPISSPFLQPQGKIIIKGQHYTTFKVRFQPQKPGFYQSTLLMNAISQVSTARNVIAVSLKGKAIA